jgi:hypothetical protein
VGIVLRGGSFSRLGRGGSGGWKRREEFVADLDSEFCLALFFWGPVWVARPRVIVVRRKKRGIEAPQGRVEGLD